MIREEIAKRILGMIAAATIAGYGISEMDTFFQGNNQSQNNQKIITETKTAVETVLKDLQNIQKNQEQKKSELIMTAFQYDEYKPITKAEICSFYPDIKECKEVKKDEKTKI